MRTIKITFPDDENLYYKLYRFSIEELGLTQKEKKVVGVKYNYLLRIIMAIIILVVISTAIAPNSYTLVTQILAICAIIKLVTLKYIPTVYMSKALQDIYYSRFRKVPVFLSSVIFTDNEINLIIERGTIQQTLSFPWSDFVSNIKNEYIFLQEKSTSKSIFIPKELLSERELLDLLHLLAINNLNIEKKECRKYDRNTYFPQS